MIKKVLQIILLAVIIIVITYFTIFLKKQIHLAQKIFIHKITTDEIVNTITYQDEFIKLNNIIALQKDVKIYQLTTEDNNTYTKQWIDVDKNNSCNTNAYFSKNIMIDKITTQNNTVIEQKYFANKIHYTPLMFNKKVIYGLPIKIHNNTNNNTTYTDLDSYVSSIDNKIVYIEKDKFSVVDDNILYSGIDYSNPQICDIKITYKYFSSTNITFLNSNIADFNKQNIINLINSKKITFSVILLIIVNIIIFCTKIVLVILKKVPNFTLQYVPFFNEYFVYSQNIYFNTFCVSLMLLCIAGECWVFGIISLIFLVIAREVDYCSI